MEPSLAFVIAVAENGTIGRDGGLPWKLSSDLKLFRRLTMGKPIIMGRRTWQSLFKKPLDGRDNIVVTRDPDFRAEGAHVVRDVATAVALARKLVSEREEDEIMVIGGAEVYRSLVDQASRIYWTQVHAEVAGDTSFPQLDPAVWREVSREVIARGPKDEYDASLVVFERVP